MVSGETPMPTIFIPTPMRRLTGGQSKVTVAANRVDEAIHLLDQEYPGFAEKLLDGQGNPKRFINIFRNDDEIRTLQGLETPVAESDRISIVPAMAGGWAAERARIGRESNHEPT
jgi:molybdopterin synthase sulfur carrier subunit